MILFRNSLWSPDAIIVIVKLNFYFVSLEKLKNIFTRIYECFWYGYINLKIFKFAIYFFLFTIEDIRVHYQICYFIVISSLKLQILFELFII